MSLLESPNSVRVLYSFPHKLGADRISHTAWSQVVGAAAAGASMRVMAGASCRPLPATATLRTTLGWGRARIPFRLLGSLRACIWHDWMVARSLPRLRDEIDVIHLWPMAALQTLRMAKQLGIPTLLERPNAHTAYAYAVVAEECRKLGMTLPRGHEHAYNPRRLNRELKEYELADKLLCPSAFVAETFLDRGFGAERIARHQYGFDETVFYPVPGTRPGSGGLQVLFAGGCAPRKGLHYALEAWVHSPARLQGKFRIAGSFVPEYRAYCARWLADPSVEVLGHRTDLAQLMRESDILVLPSIEEGSALVTYEARGSGCVLLVSDASGAVCRSGSDALVHRVGDVNTLRGHFNAMARDRGRLEHLRTLSLRGVPELTWTAAGRTLAAIYRAEAARVPA